MKREIKRNKWKQFDWIQVTCKIYPNFEIEKIEKKEKRI